MAVKVLDTITHEGIECKNLVVTLRGCHGEVRKIYDQDNQIYKYNCNAMAYFIDSISAHTWCENIEISMNAECLSDVFGCFYQRIKDRYEETEDI
jgi:hypothetical protein